MEGPIGFVVYFSLGLSLLWIVIFTVKKFL
jgi:hypothetical protein